MKFSTSATLFAIAVSGATAFSSSTAGRRATRLQESVQVTVQSSPIEIVEVQEEDNVGPVTAEYINAQLEKQLAKLRLKDQTSKQLEKEVRNQKIPFFVGS